ncbi:MAG: NUDIX hydrolase [Candidatus Marinimicrobia bacterium]|nr:NUDIX hydrolase [Candidatus Neomarinimicrobiota bacterium]
MNTEKDFIEHTIDSKQIFSGRLLNIYKDTVLLPTGNQSTREYIKHPGASVVIPYLGNGHIIMVKQFRYPVNAVMLELPAGKIDPGESPEKTIRRELAEETGYHPETLRPVCQIHTCVGYSDELLHLFWAGKLKECKLSADDDETIEIVKISAEEAITLALNGQITDAKTLIGLFWLKEILQDPELNRRFISE